MSERQPARSATLRVKLRYATVDQFLQKYGPNISRGGVFIPTKAPKPMGTLIHFEFVLVNGDVEASVLSGEGVVHFVRELDPGVPARAPGMGIQFTTLHDDGQVLVERALRMRAAPAEAATTADMPRGVREVTGEFELRTGPYQAVQPAPEPNAPIHDRDTAPVPLGSAPAHEGVPGPDDQASGPDVEALLVESGVSPARVEEILHRERVDASDEALEQLRRAAPPDETTAAEAVERLDELLRRR